MPGKLKGLLKNVGVFALASFTSRFLSFLFLPLYTAFLSTAEYGTIDLVNTIIQLLFPVLSLTIVDAVLRFAISGDNSPSECFSVGIKTIFLGSIALLFVLPIANLFIRNPILLAYFYIIYFVQALNSLFASFSKATSKTKEMAIITTLTSFVILALNVLFIAVFKWGINGYWTSTIIGNVVGILLYLIICKIHTYINWKEHNSELLKDMLVYSVPLIPNALFWWINSSLDRWTLTLMTSMSVVGLYSCANKLPSILSTINSIFSQAWNLSLFQDNPKERVRFFERTYEVYNEIMFCCAIGIIWLSKVVATFMFSKDFFDAWIFVPVLTFGVYINSLNSFFGSMFTANKETKTIFSTTLVGSLINIVLNFLMVYLWGAMGAGIATLISYFSVWVIRCYRLRKYYDVSINLKWFAVQMTFIVMETVFVSLDKIWWIISLLVIAYISYFLYRYSKDVMKILHRKG